MKTINNREALSKIFGSRAVLAVTIDENSITIGLSAKYEYDADEIKRVIKNIINDVEKIDEIKIMAVVNP